MFDPDTFLTVSYVMVDDFCRQHLPDEPSVPGPAPALSPSETITLALFGQFARFQSERDFFRFAKQRLVPLFPTLPHRAQFNRFRRACASLMQRRHGRAIVTFGLFLAKQMKVAQNSAYEVLDRCGVATRWCGRRGAGWLPEYTDKGLCARLGWFHGVHLLTAVSDEGVITGFGLGPASAKDQPMAEALFFARATQDTRLASAGLPVGSRCYVLDKGFSGAALHQCWRERYDVEVVCAPQRDNQGRQRWPKEWRQWLAGLRQIVESVHDKLVNGFRLGRERPHELDGLFARLSAKVALHNFCIWLNKQHERAPLAFADLLGW